jgi:hypothetical protein
MDVQAVCPVSVPRRSISNELARQTALDVMRVMQGMCWGLEEWLEFQIRKVKRGVL